MATAIVRFGATVSADMFQIVPGPPLHACLGEGMSVPEATKDADYGRATGGEKSFRLRIRDEDVPENVATVDRVIVRFHHRGEQIILPPGATIQLFDGLDAQRMSKLVNLTTGGLHVDQQVPSAAVTILRGDFLGTELLWDYEPTGAGGEVPDPFEE